MARLIDRGELLIRRSARGVAKGLIFTILVLSLALSAYAQDDKEGEVANVGNDITVDFAILPSGVSVPPSFQIAGMTFFSHGGTDPDSVQPHIADWGPPHERSYAFSDEGVTVVLPLEAVGVKLRLCTFHSDVTIEALSSAGGLLWWQIIPVSGTCDDVSISSSSPERISVVRFTGGGNESSIAWLRAILSTAPVVNAGESQFVADGEEVYLQGTAWDPYTGDTWARLEPIACPAIVGYPCPRNPFVDATWEQTGGTEVFLQGIWDSIDFENGVPRKGFGRGFEVNFTAPSVSADEIFTFRLTVTNYAGETGIDDVEIIVLAGD